MFEKTLLRFNRALLVRVYEDPGEETYLSQVPKFKLLHKVAKLHLRVLSSISQKVLIEPQTILKVLHKVTRVW